MSFKDYYQSELTALRQQAVVLCERQPSLTPFIGRGTADPDVERLLQGVSFLTARLRQTIYDDFPAITHGLIHRLWGNYLRPMPSMSIIQFDPLPQSGPARLIPRHSEVKSIPVHGVPCCFRTVFDTHVMPLELHRLEHFDRGDGATLKLGIKLTSDGHLGELQIQQLRLHLAGSPSVTGELYRGLLQQLRSAELRPLTRTGQPVNDSAGQPVRIRLDPSHLKPVGFADDEALLTGATTPQPGYRLLQEFFAFRDKFLFVDVSGLSALNLLNEETLAQASAMELQFDFRKYPKTAPRPELENIQLHCTPVVNLFRHHALPIPLKAGQQEYPLVPAEMTSHTCEIFGIEKVVGWKPGQSHHREYLASESGMRISAYECSATAALYHLNRQPSLVDETLLSICFQVADGVDETVSIDLTCTNRNLPAQLAIGDIRVPVSGASESLGFRSIRPATASHTAPLHSDHLWKVISSMSLNYISLENVKALKDILRTYDLPAFHDQSARHVSDELFDALHKVSHQNIDYLKRGIPVRGTRTLLEIRPKDAGVEAQWFLLGNVLSHFFALYASHHSFNQLHIQSSSGEHWSWDAIPGQQPAL